MRDRRFLHRFHLETSLLFIVLALSASALAQAGSIYEWRDDNGATHFTDNADRIPARYSNAVKKRPSAAAQAPAQSAADSSAAPAASPATPAVAPVAADGELETALKQARHAVQVRQLKALREQLVVKNKELSRLRRKFTVAKGRVPTQEEVKDFEKKRLEGTATAKDNPYVNTNPLSSPGLARQAYYKKLEEVRKDEERIQQLEKELAAAGMRAPESNL